MARQLLHPGPLDGAIQSGLFLSGPRRVGKTTFLKFDLIPCLEAQGALVLYVDLWSQPSANPADLVNDAVRGLLARLAESATPVLGKVKAARAALKRLSQAEVGAYGLKFSFKLDQLGQPKGVPLSRAFIELADQAQTDVVLIIDEVQHALASAAGNELLFALKAARDAVNTRPNTPGRFIFLGTGSHRAQVQEMVLRGNQAFQGACSALYPELGKEYVEDLLAQVQAHMKDRTPSIDASFQAFRLLGSKPEELLKALGALLRSPSDAPPDEQLPVIAQTLRIAAAEVELARVDGLGVLAKEIFSGVCACEEGAKGLYGARALQKYAAVMGRPVSASDVQMSLGLLADANLIMRREPGRYEVTDPFVRHAWLSRQALASELVESLPVKSSRRPRRA
jgi:hypothetical protein